MPGGDGVVEALRISFDVSWHIEMDLVVLVVPI